jgi:dinuclear metal center YbgI/SA1388 family protein
MAKLSAIVSYLDKELRIDKFEDSSNNGLQVGSSEEVKKVCCGVDASIPFFERAADSGADLLVCHHGMSWGDSLKYLTGMNYNRVRCLLQNDMALYACHLPLDAHPRYGNNALIFKKLGLVKRRGFGEHRGALIGYAGELPKPMRYDSFKKLVRKVAGNEIQTMDFGKKTIRSVAIVSGGAAGDIEGAALEGVDVYVSGEPNLAARNLAEEYGINGVFAGHYATETFGVRALGGILRKKFGVKAEFLDMGIGF